MANLAELRKTVETGMDPRLQYELMNKMWNHNEISFSVAICPAAEKGLTKKKTKCPAVRKFSNFLKIPFLIVGKYSIFYLLECEL